MKTEEKPSERLHPSLRETQMYVFSDIDDTLVGPTKIVKGALEATVNNELIRKIKDSGVERIVICSTMNPSNVFDDISAPYVSTRPGLIEALKTPSNKVDVLMSADYKDGVINKSYDKYIRALYPENLKNLNEQGKRDYLSDDFDVLRQEKKSEYDKLIDEGQVKYFRQCIGQYFPEPEKSRINEYFNLPGNEEKLKAYLQTRNPATPFVPMECKGLELTGDVLAQFNTLQDKFYDAWKNFYGNKGSMARVFIDNNRDNPKNIVVVFFEDDPHKIREMARVFELEKKARGDGAPRINLETVHVNMKNPNKSAESKKYEVLVEQKTLCDFKNGLVREKLVALTQIGEEIQKQKQVLYDDLKGMGFKGEFKDLNFNNVRDDFLKQLDPVNAEKAKLKLKEWDLLSQSSTFLQDYRVKGDTEKLKDDFQAQQNELRGSKGSSSFFSRRAGVEKIVGVALAKIEKLIKGEEFIIDKELIPVPPPTLTR